MTSIIEISNKEQKKLEKQIKDEKIAEEKDIKKKQKAEDKEIKDAKIQEDKQIRDRKKEENELHKEENHRRRRERAEKIQEEQLTRELNIMEEQNRLNLLQLERERVRKLLEKTEDKDINFNTTYRYNDWYEYTRRKKLTKLQLLEYANKYLHNVFGIVLRAGRAIIKRESLSAVSILDMNDWTPYYQEKDGELIKKKMMTEDLINEVRLTTYQDIRFNPEFIGHFYDVRENVRYINKWNGYEFNRPEFKIEKNDIDMKRVNPVLDFIREVICDNNPDCYKYVSDWITHILKHPHIKTKVCLFLHSAEFGTGKNSFVNLMTLLIGEGYCYSSADSLITLGHFNTMNENKLLVCMDEGRPVDITQHRKDFDMFKNKISEDTEAITPKGVDTYNAKSYSNYILCSQHKNSIDIPNETERRFLCLSVNPKYAVKKSKNTTQEQTNLNTISKDYFDNLYNNHYTIDNLPHIFSYFYNRDITSVNITQIPQTELRNNLLKNHKESNNNDEFITYLKEGHFTQIINTLYNPNLENRAKKENKTTNTPALKSMKYCILDTDCFLRVFKPHMMSLGLKDNYIMKLPRFRNFMEENGFLIIHDQNEQHFKLKYFNLNFSNIVFNNTDTIVIGKTISSKLNRIEDIEDEE